MTNSVSISTLLEHDVPKCDSQQPQPNVGEQCEPPVEELQVYSRHPKSKAILQPLSKTPTPDSSNLCPL
jgi:hypothetical protein